MVCGSSSDARKKIASRWVLDALVHTIQPKMRRNHLQSNLLPAAEHPCGDMPVMRTIPCQWAVLAMAGGKNGCRFLTRVGSSYNEAIFDRFRTVKRFTHFDWPPTKGKFTQLFPFER